MPDHITAQLETEFRILNEMITYQRHKIAELSDALMDADNESEREQIANDIWDLERDAQRTSAKIDALAAELEQVDRTNVA